MSTSNQWHTMRLAEYDSLPSDRQAVLEQTIREEFYRLARRQNRPLARQIIAWSGAVLVAFSATTLALSTIYRLMSQTFSGAPAPGPDGFSIALFAGVLAGLLLLAIRLILDRPSRYDREDHQITPESDGLDDIAA